MHGHLNTRIPDSLRRARADRRKLPKRRAPAAAFLIAAMLILSACGGKSKVQPPPPPPPAPAPAPAPMLRAEVRASSTSNLGPGGQALPIVVRIYELKSQGGFAGSDFFSLYNTEGDVLMGDLISREELTLAPGRIRNIEKPLNAETRYLGVLGAFRDIDRATWRAVAPVAAGGDNDFVVDVGSSSVRVSAD